MISFEPMIYRIADIWEWNNRKELILSPKYQRRSVWSSKAKSYLIDTIIRGLPLPKLFMKYSVDIKTKKSIREVIDGQQRIRAILSYLDDGFKIMSVHNKEFGGRYFNELDDETKKLFWEFKISVDILSSADEGNILDIFARLNTYTVKLEKQELLNSKYFGAFKQLVYSLGFQYKDFWVNNGIISEAKISRMAEAEFTSELVILLLVGPQDKKNIETYYKQYDDEFDKEKEIRRNFTNLIEIIVEIFGDDIKNTKFSTTPLFYSLFGVINELKNKKNLKTKDYPKIKNALLEIDGILTTNAKEIDQKYFGFYDASTKHVSDLKSRQLRHSFLLDFIQNKIK